MIRLLADHNLVAQSRLIWSVFAHEDWRDFGVDRLLLFSDIGLPINADDRTIWIACQSADLLLLTGNRNDDGIDSLTNVIAELNQAKSLPVLTVGRPAGVADFAYRENCAYRIADVMINLGTLRGTGRIFIP